MDGPFTTLATAAYAQAKKPCSVVGSDAPTPVVAVQGYEPVGIGRGR